MTDYELLQTVREIACTFGRGTLTLRDKRTKRVKPGIRGVRPGSIHVLPDTIVMPIPGIEPGRTARTPGLVVRGTDPVNADDIASEAMVLILRRKRDRGEAYVIDREACRLAVVSAYRHAMRSLHRESMNLAAPAWYYRCLMPAVPAVPETVVKHYGERPNVPKYCTVVKGKLVSRDNGTLQEWTVITPARPARPAYRSLRKRVPSDPSVIVEKRICRGYARPDRPTGNSSIRETLEYAEVKGTSLDNRTGTVLRTLSNPSFKNGKIDVSKNDVAKNMGVNVRTVQRIIAATEPFVRECNGRHTDRYNRANQLPIDPLPPVVPFVVRPVKPCPVPHNSSVTCRTTTNIVNRYVWEQWYTSETVSTVPESPVTPIPLPVRRPSIRTVIRSLIASLDASIELLTPSVPVPDPVPVPVPVDSLDNWRDANYKNWYQSFSRQLDQQAKDKELRSDGNGIPY